MWLHVRCCGSSQRHANPVMGVVGLNRVTVIAGLTRHSAWPAGVQSPARFLPTHHAHPQMGRPWMLFGRLAATLSKSRFVSAVAGQQRSPLEFPSGLHDSAARGGSSYARCPEEAGGIGNPVARGSPLIQR